MDAIQFAAEAGKKVLVHAKGNPAKIVAVGVAAEIVTVTAGNGFCIWKGSVLISDKFSR